MYTPSFFSRQKPNDNYDAASFFNKYENIKEASSRTFQSKDLDIKLKSITSAASGKIHFQIQSRSSILYSGSYDLQTSENVASIDSSILTTDNVNVKKIEKRETSSNIILF